MAASNLAIIFGPTLLLSSIEENAIAFMNNIGEYCKIVELLILHVRISLKNSSCFV